MTRYSIVRRPMAVLACLIQLVLGGAGGFADAWLESASAGPATAHVEETGALCPPVHSDDCVVCRQLTMVYGPSTEGTRQSVADASASRFDRGTAAPASARLTRALLPRAPPLA